MNAKTTKFLAVIAVLAIAFAGVAVLVQVQTDDADTVDATTAASYNTDRISEGGIVKIALENTASAKSVVLYKPKVGTTPATAIEAGKAYYFNADATVLVPNTLWEEGRFVFFILNGVEVKFVRDATDTDLKWTNSVGLQFINVASEEDGVITLDAPRAGEKAFDQDGYAGAAITTEGDGWTPEKQAEFKNYGAIDRFLAVGDEDNSVIMKADNRDVSKFIYGDMAILNVSSDCTITGEIERVNFLEPDVEITFVEFTGTIANARVDPSSTIVAKNFTGSIKSSDPVTGALILSASESGSFDSVTGSLVLESNVIASFKNGATIAEGTTFTYTDEYNDVHSFQFKFLENDAEVTTEKMTVGMGGLFVYSGKNMIGVNGTFSVKSGGYTADLIFTGNAKLSGTIYNGWSIVQITNNATDVKVSTLQTVGGGWVVINGNVLVESGKSFYSGAATKIADGFILKVAEDAIFKTQESLIINGNGQVWNAGIVSAPSYTSNGATEYTDAELTSHIYRVFMDSETGFGTFWKGTDEYDVGKTAFGAYLDVTGKCTVNLSSEISVVNPLYKYRTMILATFDNTVALTASYGNQYGITAELDGKDYSGPEMTAKSATWRNVAWNSPNYATIYINAPETYIVDLAKTIQMVDDVPAVPTEVTSEWDSTGIEVTRADDPAKEPVSIIDGKVELIFDVEYNVTGLTKTSNYKFISTEKDLTDLTKDSQVQGSFTMVRNNTILWVTEGIASTITVSLDVDDDYESAAMNVGDPIIKYKIEEDGEEKTLSYASAANGMVINLFSNDDIFIKAVHKDFAYFGIVAPEDVADAQEWNGRLIPTELTTVDWTDMGSTGIDDTTGKSEVTLALFVTADCADCEYTLAGDVEVAEGQQITVTWIKPSPDQESTTVTLDDGDDFTVYADEVIKIEWTNVDPDHVRLAMKIAGEDYEAGTEITVPSGISDVDLIDVKLTATEIQYVQVTNSTDKQIIVSDNTGHQRIIEKTKTNEEALELVPGEDEAGNTVAVKVGVKGQAVVSWHYKVLREANADAAELICEADVIGDTTTITGGTTATQATYVIKANDIIEISNLSTVPVAYIVKTQPTEHSQIGDYSRVGNMGDNMFIYVKADEGFTIPGVEVWNEDPNHEGFPGTFYDDAVFDKSEKYWTYTMPDNNVVLIIKEQKETYDLTYVNQDGEVVIAKRAVKTGSAVTDEVPYVVGKTAASAVPDVEIPSFNFDKQNQTISFNMPEADVIVTINYVDDDYSKNVMVTVGQRGADIALVITALDGKTVASGTIYMTVTYTYLDEDGEISTDNVTVPVTFKADGSAHAVVYDNEFIEELGENYSGAFAVTGTFEFGLAEGSLFKTVYTPVLEA